MGRPIRDLGKTQVVNDRVRSLDGIRAVSVFGVILSGSGWLAPFGWVGVLAFYVLSGFLITRILLAERAAATGLPGFLGRFYFRRTLRIFPLYFAYLLALELLFRWTQVPAGWPETRPFALTYTVNYGILTKVVEASPAFGHLWTLSVEEQYYLLWPLVVWGVSRRRLIQVALALVVTAPLLRFLSHSALGLDIGQVYVSSLSHLDAFAFGALLASCAWQPTRRVLPLAIGASAVTLLLGGLVIWGTGAAIRTLGYREGVGDAAGYIWAYTVLNATLALWILTAMQGELRALGHPVLAYLGRISYGIYLFQRPLVGLYKSYGEPLLATHVHSQAVLQGLGVLICVAGVIPLAAASYHGFEAPLLRWRDKKVAPLGSGISRQ